ncbi:hypothetical protein DY000_02035899 [Brassica cretica]|uniref:FAR1 domain-containing protein n=1 Tax=Brassica cretica TaxID=69181 RepID=A0ABQ7DUJ4_BRACR|nr:hypothetical protein DY000_02035899 [Brassica cretica]
MVAFDFMNTLRTLWPFSLFTNDIKESKEIVQRLSLPSSTKNFIFAIRVPEHDSTIYILSAQNLSQRSATDAESLIRELRPDAVVAQVNKSALGEAQVEESVSDSIPTSAFRVLKQCFVDKVNKEKYESVAGILVMREIFGTSFNGHVLAAKRAASEVGCSFMVLESPFVNIAAIEGSYEESDTLGKLYSNDLSELMAVEFESEDAAKMFYDDYSRSLGFVMRVMSCRRSERDGRILARRFGCNKEGRCVSVRGNSGSVRKPRQSTREGCKAMVHVKYDRSGKHTNFKML